MKFVDPKNDVAFKKIFGNEEKKEILISFLNAVLNLDVVPKSADTKALQAAYDVANRFSWSRNDLEVYEYWGMKAQDERGRMQVAQEEALKQGLEQGLEQGRQGAQQKIVQSMFAKGLEPAAIAELTGLSVEEITAFAR